MQQGLVANFNTRFTQFRPGERVSAVGEPNEQGEVRRGHAVDVIDDAADLVSAWIIAAEVGERHVALGTPGWNCSTGVDQLQRSTLSEDAVEHDGFDNRHSAVDCAQVTDDGQCIQQSARLGCAEAREAKLRQALPQLPQWDDRASQLGRFLQGPEALEQAPQCIA